jgi:hypothetical protein
VAEGIFECRSPLARDEGGSPLRSPGVVAGLAKMVGSAGLSCMVAEQWLDALRVNTAATGFDANPGSEVALRMLGVLLNMAAMGSMSSQSGLGTWRGAKTFGGRLEDARRTVAAERLWSGRRSLPGLPDERSRVCWRVGGVTIVASGLLILPLGVG